MKSAPSKRTNSLRKKLLVNSVSTSIASFTLVGVLISYGLTKLSSSFLELNDRQAGAIKKNLEGLSSDNIQRITTLYQRALERKGRALIQKDAASAATMFEDNSFNLLRDFLQRNVHDDPEIIVASFSTLEGREIKAWQYVSSQYPKGLALPIEYDLKSRAWTATYGNGKKVRVSDPLIPELSRLDAPKVRPGTIELEDESGAKKTIQAYICTTPIYKKLTAGPEIQAARKRGEAIGYLRYVISLAGMEKAIAEQKKVLEASLDALQKENKRVSQESTEIAHASLQQIYFLTALALIGVLIFAYVVSLIYSAKISRPVGELTLVAEDMARGNYCQDIRVTSDDEIGVLARAFQEMSLAITKRDEELAKINRELEKMVEKRTIQLQEQLNLVSNLLNNMKQAVFSIDSEMRIVPPVSNFATTLFGAKIEGQSIQDLIYKDLNRQSEDYSTLLSALTLIFGEDEFQWLVSEGALPKKLTVDLQGTPRTLKISYNPLWTPEGALEKLMYIVEDITEVLALEKKVESEKAASARKIQIIQELVSRSNAGLDSFFASATRLLVEISEEFRRSSPNLGMIQRHLHSLKGNARGYGLTLLSGTIHQTETDLAAMPRQSSPEEIKQRLSDVPSVFNEYAALAERVLHVKTEKHDSPSIGILPSNLKRLESLLREHVEGKRQVKPAELLSAFQRLKDVPLTDSLTHYSEMVTELSASLGKKVELKISGSELFLPQDQVAPLNDAIGHILRNAIDHGIESPEQRAAAGKPQAGKILIQCSDEMEEVRIRIIDDGQGIAPDALVRIALEKGLIKSDQIPSMSDQDKVNLIFLPNFSTRATVSEISGRGVGMDAVQASITGIGGTIQVTSRAGSGTEFLLRFKRC